MSLIKIALLFTLLTCGNDFLPFLMSKSTASAFSFRKNVPILVPESFTRFLFSSETNPEINSQEKWLDYVRSNPIARLFGLHNDLKEAGVDFREFDLAQYEPELHHGTGPVVINSADVPVVSRTRRSAPLSEEEWLAKAKAQYEARDARQLHDVAQNIHEQIVNQFVKRLQALEAEEVGTNVRAENMEVADDASTDEASTEESSTEEAIDSENNDELPDDALTLEDVIKEHGAPDLIQTKFRVTFVKPVAVQKRLVRVPCKGLLCHFFSS